MTLAHDEITLTVPASAEFARIARLTTSEIASNVGFSMDQVEQLKVAVGEVWSMVVSGDDRDDPLTFRFVPGPSTLVIDVDAHHANGAVNASRIEITEKLLAETVDQHEVSSDGARVHLVKRAR